MAWCKLNFLYFLNTLLICKKKCTVLLQIGDIWVWYAEKTTLNNMKYYLETKTIHIQNMIYKCRQLEGVCQTARCMGLDKVEPWIIFTWQKPWINHNWFALSHALVRATRLYLQVSAEMDNSAALRRWLASLTSWNGSHHRTQTNSVSVNRAFHAVSHLPRCMLNGPVRPICQAVTRPNTHRRTH